MKLRIAIFAALALMAFDRVSGAEEASQRLKAADQASMWLNRAPQAPPRYGSYGSPPVACEAVIFPRSPLCAGRPSTFGPFNNDFHFPWNYWYY
jgi:hypothetical protein